MANYISDEKALEANLVSILNKHELIFNNYFDTPAGAVSSIVTHFPNGIGVEVYGIHDDGTPLGDAFAKAFKDFAERFEPYDFAWKMSNYMGDAYEVQGNYRVYIEVDCDKINPKAIYDTAYEYKNRIKDAVKEMEEHYPTLFVPKEAEQAKDKTTPKAGKGEER